MDRLALVVDDSMLIRHTVSRFLEERGFKVQAATNGAEALEVLERLRPQLIITDLDMPKMTGAELISELLRKKETADIPIIVVAGRQRTTSPPPLEGSSRCVLLPANVVLIHKDIDITVQLDHAISELIGA